MNREAHNPLQAWKLISRVDSSGTVELYYSVTRRSDPGSIELFSSPLWIKLERSASDGTWQTVSLRVYY